MVLTPLPAMHFFRYFQAGLNLLDLFLREANMTILA
jgi:hypothetical protein